ncbi:MAG: ATPase domain-containing protein [Nitrososphaerales archaeon]
MPTGIAGLDRLVEGGFPARSLIVLGGRPGSGKTILASQFLYEGATHDQHSVYVSFAESKDQFLSNMRRLNMDFGKLTDRGTFLFMDFTAITGEAVSDALNLIVKQVESSKTKRMVIDSFTAIAQGFEKLIDARIALQVVVGRLVRDEGCTTVLLVEMPYGTDRIGRGIEEFVADGIVILDILEKKGGPRRTISIRKMRGTKISLAASTYDIRTNGGLVVYPAIEFRMDKGLGEKRIMTGIPSFDESIEGGFLERSVTAIVGAAGTGKTTFGLGYVYHGAAQMQENGLLISYGESEGQLRTVASHFGMNRIQELEASGTLRIASQEPERLTPEAHALHFEKLLDETRAKRVVIDDVTGLKAICSPDEFYQLLKRISQISKSRDTTTLVTLTTSELAGLSITGSGLSTLMDGIIMFRYVELDGKMERSMILLKMRGTRHDHHIKKFDIGLNGFRIEGSFSGYSGILSGSARKSIKEFELNERKIAEREKKVRERRVRKFESDMKKPTRPLRKGKKPGRGTGSSQ